MTFDGNNGYSLNVSLPWTTSSGSIYAVREGDKIIGGTAGKNNGTFVQPGYLWALSLKPGSEGTLLWNITFTPPQQIPDVAISGLFLAGAVTLTTVDPEAGVFLFSESIGQRRWGYSLATGQQIWGPTTPEPALNYYGTGLNVYQGMLLSTGYGGVMIAYDIKTGKVLWNYTASQVGFESPYGNFPMGIGAIADGKIYIGAGEHSVTQPPWRGPILRCINASNGAELWKLPILGVAMPGGNAGENFAIADGFLLALNGYDNQIYCMGKGPSATTVSAPQTVITRGESIMITGTVTDQSAGAVKLAKTLGYVNGVPAISDDNMDAWMEYLYMQQGIPGNAKGVDVSLDTLDPNGNFVHIDTVTSDINGMFKKLWNPEVPGEYTVIATFAGSKSYYSSYSETAVGVVEAPPATAPPVYPQPIDNTMVIVGMGIAIIIAIAIATVLILLRKK
jgi:hypothetical protein